MSVAPINLHEIARALYHLKHGNWGYDPGTPKHRKWYERAEVFAETMGLSSESVSNSDGASSWPPNPATDRPETYSRRIVGPWRRDPSPARDLAVALGDK